MAAKKVVVSKEVLKKNGENIKKKGGGIIKEFVAFINRGSVVDLAVGVIIGGAFSAIVTAVVNIFLSLCTWAVPGGLTGLVTVLPAANPGQQGVAGIGQSFTDITDATIKFAAAQGVTITKDSATFMQFQDALRNQYTARGTTFFFNGSALINWGTLLNAVISFLIIALVLFAILKAVNRFRTAKEELKAKAQEEFYKLHPEQRPAPVVPGTPAPTQMDILLQIRDELKKQNSPK